MADTSAAPGAGPIASLRALGSTLLELLGTRAELAVVELREEAERRKEMLVLALAASVFLGLALVFASLFVIAAFWDTHRLVAIAGVTLFHLAIGVRAIVVLRRKAAASPAPFEATLNELARDRDMLRGLRE